MTKEIPWNDGAACYAGGNQWYLNENNEYNNKPIKNCFDNEFVDFDWVISCGDFQLNHIRTGDYIETSELETEQKYNDVVEVFGLFGHKWGFNAATRYLKARESFALGASLDGLWIQTKNADRKRRLTYSQIMTIGKLKRMMDEKSAPEATPDFTPDFTPDHRTLPPLDNLDNLVAGQKHDQSKPRFSLIPLAPLQDVIAVLEFGAEKYGADNWKHVENPQQRYLDAAMRHIMAWQSGDLVDEESGLPHLAHAQCCLLFLQHFDNR